MAELSIKCSLSKDSGAAELSPSSVVAQQDVRGLGGMQRSRLGDQGRLHRLPLFAWDIQVAYPLAGVCSQNKIPLSLWKETLATGPECGQAVWIICLATYGAFERDEFQKTFTPAG